MGQREHQAPEETKQGQKCLRMQPGSTPVYPHSPREVAKGLCKNETATACVYL